MSSSTVLCTPGKGLWISDNPNPTTSFYPRFHGTCFGIQLRELSHGVDHRILTDEQCTGKTKYMFFKCLKLQLSMDTVHFCHKHGICDDEQYHHSDGTCIIDSMLRGHPVKQSVSRLSKDKRFYELAQSYRRRTKHTDDRICDIYDGIANKKC